MRRGIHNVQLLVFLPVQRCGGAVPGELPGQCEFSPRGKRGQVGTMGPSTTPSLQANSSPSQTSPFPAVLGCRGHLGMRRGGLATRQARQATRQSGPGRHLLPVSPQELDCLVIDNNGFILISERSQEVRYPGSGRRGVRSSLTQPGLSRASGPGSRGGFGQVRVNGLKQAESLPETMSV